MSTRQEAITKVAANPQYHPTKHASRARRMAKVCVVGVYAAPALLLVAVWAPHHWQWAATGVLVGLISGAGLGLSIFHASFADDVTAERANNPSTGVRA